MLLFPGSLYLVVGQTRWTRDGLRIGLGHTVLGALVFLGVALVRPPPLSAFPSGQRAVCGGGWYVLVSELHMQYVGTSRAGNVLVEIITALEGN